MGGFDLFLNVTSQSSFLSATDKDNSYSVCFEEFLHELCKPIDWPSFGAPYTSWGDGHNFFLFFAFDKGAGELDEVGIEGIHWYRVKPGLAHDQAISWYAEWLQQKTDANTLMKDGDARYLEL